MFLTSGSTTCTSDLAYTSIRRLNTPTGPKPTSGTQASRCFFLGGFFCSKDMVHCVTFCVGGMMSRFELFFCWALVPSFGVENFTSRQVCRAHLRCKLQTLLKRFPVWSLCWTNPKFFESGSLSCMRG